MRIMRGCVVIFLFWVSTLGALIPFAKEAGSEPFLDKNIVTLRVNSAWELKNSLDALAIERLAGLILDCRNMERTDTFYDGRLAALFHTVPVVVLYGEEGERFLPMHLAAGVFEVAATTGMEAPGFVDRAIICTDFLESKRVAKGFRHVPLTEMPLKMSDLMNMREWIVKNSEERLATSQNFRALVRHLAGQKKEYGNSDPILRECSDIVKDMIFLSLTGCN